MVITCTLSAPFFLMGPLPVVCKNNACLAYLERGVCVSVCAKQHRLLISFLTFQLFVNYIMVRGVQNRFRGLELTLLSSITLRTPRPW